MEDLTLPQISEGMEQDRIERLNQQIQEELESFNKGMAEIGNGSIKMAPAYGRNYTMKRV